LSEKFSKVPNDERRVQTAYEASRHDPAAESLSERIATAMYRYLVEDLGRSQTEARERADKEMAGEIGRGACDELAEMGIAIAGKRVLDLGAGLGGLSVELARRGAHVIGLEPGAGWCHIASERLKELGSGDVIAAVGEAIPLASRSVDVIVSLQVLEHVQSPGRVIQEAFRVLRPGGFFYFAYENYLSFWEPHYRVAWLPLLPKPLGAVYLRWRGKNPQFLLESVTYTTFHGVRKMLKAAGFKCMRTQKSAEMLASGGGNSLKWQVLKGISELNKPAALAMLTGFDFSRRMLRTAVYECMRKPA
jgi:2-polyprenyl-3-methyl-5-hydroxy-6-metoxy-1,4-benzoquinol methylase